MIVLPFAPEEPPPPVKLDQPHKLVLLRWRAWEVQVPIYDAPSWHLVGFLREEGCAKVSSAIALVNRAGDEVRTKTARLYSTAAVPGVDDAAERLWRSWQRQHRVKVLREVTSEVLAGHQPGPVHLKSAPHFAQAEAATSLRGQRAW